MGKGGRRKIVPTIIHPGDPLGRWGAVFYCRNNRIMQLRALGPRVKASTPEELIQKTAEALADEFKDKEPN